MRAIRGDAQEPAPPAGVRGARSRCKQRAGEGGDYEGYGAGGAYVAGRGKRGRAGYTGRGARLWGCGARRREARRAICGARSACAGRGSGEEARTMNIARMFVTRDVSRRSGWLKPSLCCREGRKQGIPQRGAPCGRWEADVREEGRGEGNAEQLKISVGLM